MLKTNLTQRLLLSSLTLILSCGFSSGISRNADAQETQAQADEYRQDEKILCDFGGRKDLAEKDLTELEATTTQLTAKWRDRDQKHSNEVIYTVCGILAWNDFHSSRQNAMAQKFFAVSLKNPDQIPLEIASDLVSTLAHMDERLKREQQPAIRKTRVAQWAYIFERMDKETDPNFDVRDEPGTGSGLFLGRRDPAQLKAEQERFERNEAKLIYFNHQYWLASKRYQYVSSALWHIKAAFTTKKDARELRDLLIDTRLKPDFKTEILEAVNKNAQQSATGK